MRKSFIFIMALLSAAFVSCGGSDSETPENADSGNTEERFHAKGADISWVTEMESKGYKFYDASGNEMECTALMKSIGFNAVRYRVWVNPSDGWNSKADVLEKARRAQALGMKIMIDFHLSDSWADPGKQNPPEAWKSLSVNDMATEVANHVKDVLSTLKSNGIAVEWVQVGNEVTNGMLWESGRVKGQEASNFVKYFNAGRDAAKAVYSDAKVILHIDNGWKMETLSWFYGLMNAVGANYDIIGLSLYPSYWDSSADKYADWETKTKQCVANLATLHEAYSKPVMLVEFGMPASEPAETAEALEYILGQTKALDWFGGIFYWEPESEHSRNGYDYGAFSGGKATAALAPFAK